MARFEGSLLLLNLFQYIFYFFIVFYACSILFEYFGDINPIKYFSPWIYSNVDLHSLKKLKFDVEPKILSRIVSKRHETKVLVKGLTLQDVLHKTRHKLNRLQWLLQYVRAVNIILHCARSPCILQCEF